MALSLQSGDAPVQVGKVTCVLAKTTYFGLDVLRASTV